MAGRVAIIFGHCEEHIEEIVTDDPSLKIYSVDENCPADRIYQFGPHAGGFVRLISAAEMDKLLAGPVGKLGDRPVQEQAVRALFGRGNDGRPKLAIVKDDDK